MVVVSLPAVLVNLFPGCVPRVDLARPPSATRSTRWTRAGRACATASAIRRPRIRRHINVFVAGERATLETRLAPGAEMMVMTAISGG